MLYVVYSKPMQAILHIVTFLDPRRVLERRARKRLRQKVDAGASRAIKEYQKTFEQLKQYDRQ